MAKLSRDGFPGLIPLAGSEDLYIQMGRGNFNGVYTDVTDVSVQTQLTHFDFASAVAYDTQQPHTEGDHSTLFVDPAPSSGAFSVYRSSSSAAAYGASGMPFKYILIGRVESTD